LTNVANVDELKIYLEKEPLDVLSINETRLDETINTDTDTVSIPGYDMVAVIGKEAVLQFTIAVF
jgi:hypothetical protein